MISYQVTHAFIDSDIDIQGGKVFKEFSLLRKWIGKDYNGSLSISNASRRQSDMKLNIINI